MVKIIAMAAGMVLCACSGFAQTEENTFISGNKNAVAVYADPRILVLAKNPASVSHVPTIRSGRGYRVQIYNGTDRLKAMEIKRAFTQQHPSVRTYLSYVQPQFRVKVGDYKRREEAAEMYREVSKQYSPCMIVPDMVTIKENIDDQPNTGENE